MPRPTPAPFTVQDLIDAVHKAIDDENIACESPARQGALVVADETPGFAFFVPQHGGDEIDVSVLPSGQWEVWNRETGWFDRTGRGLPSCVEACLDALDEMGVL